MATKNRSSKATHTEPKDFVDEVIELASRDEVSFAEVEAVDTLADDQPSPAMQGPRTWIVSGQTPWADVHAQVEAFTSEEAKMKIAQSFANSLWVTPRAT